jgi:hypothetical protein
VTRVILVLLLSGCAAAPKEPIRAPPPDPGELLLRDLEQRLLRAKSVLVVSTLESSGAVNARLAARLVVGDGQRALLDVDGTFEGKPAHARLRSDGEELVLNKLPPAPVPAELRDSLLLGLVRMGLLHNAALSVANEAPDHADGGVHHWVRIERARAGEPATDISFDIVLARKPVGRAALSLDEQGRPTKRKQRVDLDVGELVVHERYDVFEVDQPIEEHFEQ